MFVLLIGIYCIACISSQLIQTHPYFHVIKKFPLNKIRRFLGENMDHERMGSRVKHMMFEDRTKLTQLNRILKKPVFNFANLFRRHWP